VIAQQTVFQLPPAPENVSSTNSLLLDRGARYFMIDFQIIIVFSSESDCVAMAGLVFIVILVQQAFSSSLLELTGNLKAKHFKSLSAPAALEFLSSAFRPGIEYGSEENDDGL
jgi:hypothetical protein